MTDRRGFLRSLLALPVAALTSKAAALPKTWASPGVLARATPLRRVGLYGYAEWGHAVLDNRQVMDELKFANGSTIRVLGDSEAACSPIRGIDPLPCGIRDGHVPPEFARPDAGAALSSGDASSPSPFASSSVDADPSGIRACPPTPMPAASAATPSTPSSASPPSPS